jgi:serine/threonine protein kinase
MTSGDTLVRLVEQAGRLQDTMHFSVDLAGETPSEFDGTIAWETPSITDPGTPVPAGLHDHPRYRLVRQIGEGGMGTVWLAEHLVLGRNVALKVIRSEFLVKPGAVERFRRESRAVAKLQHANIVAAYDAEEAGGTHFLVMEYVEGVNLSDLIKANGAMSVADVVRAGVDTALGLAAAHAAGMIHRDIKPHNLIRTKSGRTKILDFGLATAEAGSGEITGENVVMGTPDYIAPEQTVDAHAADARSDIYSLGCAIYVMLTGKVPFPVAGTMQKFFAHQHTAARPIRDLRPEVPAALEEVVTRMMAKRPGDRYQSALEVAEALTESKTADRNSERKPSSKSRRG